MNSNFRRPNSSSQFAAVLRWVVVAVFICVAGLSYVALKNQMYAGGLQKHALENELSNLISQNNVMATQIGNLTSMTTLQRRVDEGFIKLVPINPVAVIHVHGAESHFLADNSRGEFHPVSHTPGRP